MPDFNPENTPNDRWEIVTPEPLSEDALNKHLAPIVKGQLGKVSKIEEELAELKDALEQGNPIMALVELSDLYGAMEAYLKENHPNISMDDLRKANGLKVIS